MQTSCGSLRDFEDNDITDDLESKLAMTEANTIPPHPTYLQHGHQSYKRRDSWNILNTHLLLHLLQNLNNQIL